MTTRVEDLEAPGMGPVLGPGPGIGGEVKVAPEDFEVEEIPLLPPRADGQGKWTVATVRSTGWETHRLARKIAEQVGVDRDRIHFAGTKDRQAVTTQLVAVPAPLDDVEAVDLGDVELLEAYRTDRAPKIGELHGNRFRIVVRNVDDDPTDGLTRRVEAIRDRGGVPNYFGPQRFGSVRPITHRVGEAIVRGDPEDAVRWYVGRPFPGESPDARRARELADDDRWEDALAALPAPFGHERRMLTHLLEAPDDWVGAFRTLPERLQQLVVYAYQSALFNRLVGRRIEADLPLDRSVVGDLVCDVTDEGFPDADRLVVVHEGNLDAVDARVRAGKAWVTGPLFGTETPLARGRSGEMERAVLEEEELTPPDLHIPRLPDLTPRGIRRPLTCPVQGLTWETRDGSAVLEFSLPKGSYATCVLREILA